MVALIWSVGVDVHSVSSTLALVSFVSTAMTVCVIATSAKVVVTCARVKNFDLNQVEYQANDRHNQHDPAFDFWRVKEPLRRFEDEPDGHDPHTGDADERSDDLGPMPPIR